MIKTNELIDLDKVEQDTDDLLFYVLQWCDEDDLSLEWYFNAKEQSVDFIYNKLKLANENKRKYLIEEHIIDEE